jgi:hypothetical protein
MKILRIDDPFAAMGSDYNADADIFRQKGMDEDGKSSNNVESGVSSGSGDTREGQDNLGRSGEVHAGAVQCDSEDGSHGGVVPAVAAGGKRRENVDAMQND